MRETLSGLVCGLLFGLGLVVSGMAYPTKVLGFLDLFGDWDPSLAIVMAAALVVAIPGYLWARRQARPLAAPRFSWPALHDVDGRLIGGAVLFGLGWGLVGLCPGPAIVDIASLSPKLIGFVVAMAVGMTAHHLWSRRMALAIP
ncbi:MAG TPA: DUF6691 family protein [Hyphomicrobiales bacterium]|nr:DUF6691 family protein [Hyphomicrobiales bacterium]